MNVNMKMYYNSLKSYWNVTKMTDTFSYKLQTNWVWWGLKIGQLLYLQFINWIICLFQIFIAIPLETEQGSFRTLLVYLGGILFGALGSMVFNPTLSMVGASAGVYSLLMSHISHCILVIWIIIAYDCGILNYKYFSLAELSNIVILLPSDMCCSDTLFLWYHLCTHSSLHQKWIGATDKHSSSCQWCSSWNSVWIFSF